MPGDGRDTTIRCKYGLIEVRLNVREFDEVITIVFDVWKGAVFFSVEIIRLSSKPFIQQLVKKGIAVFASDIIGFGNRLMEGSSFYQRYPRWSNMGKMGKMVADVKGAVDALSNLALVSEKQIYTACFSLGGTVALFSSSMDERLDVVISVAGFTPVRGSDSGKGKQWLWSASHHHGLLPRAGFFVEHENRGPVDFDQIISCIAPRPLLIIAHRRDKDASYPEVQDAFHAARRITDLEGDNSPITLLAPDDYHRFSPAVRDDVCSWLMEQVDNQPVVTFGDIL